MNYLDLLRTNQTPVPAAQPLPGASSPLPAFLSMGQPVQPEPMMQPEPVAAPQMAPRPVVQAAPAEVNPFDQFDAPAPAPAAATPTRAPGSRKVTPAPVAQPATPAPVTVKQEASPEVAAAIKAFQSDISRLINTGATREQIVARIAEAQTLLPGITVDFEKSLAYRAKHPGVAIPTSVRAPEVAPLPKDTHGEDKGVLDAVGTGLATGITMNGVDELGGAIGATTNSIAGMFGGGTGESWTDAYGRIRDDNRQAMEDARYHNPGFYLGGELAGNLVTAPLTSIRGAAGVGRVVAEGAGQGFVNGFNSGTDGFMDRLETGAIGGAVGGVVGGVVGGASNFVARRVAQNRAGGANPVIEAADRLNRVGTPDEITGPAAIRPLVGQVSNGGAGSQAQALLQPTLLGGLPGGLWKAQGRFEDAVEGAANRIADTASGGRATDLVTTAGIVGNRNVPGSLGSYAFNTEAAARSVYGAAEQASQGVMVPTPRAIAKLDEAIQRYAVETPGDVPGLAALQNLRASLAAGPNPNSTSAGWSIEGLRRLRTSFGDNLDSNSRTAKQVANEIWGPLSEDIFRGLRVAGRPDAAALFRTADAMWARRAAGMEVIQRVIGKENNLSPDAIAANLASMSRRDYVHLARALREIDPAQAGMVRGSLIQELGQPIASRATSEGGFSLESFTTRWNGLSNHAKRAMYDPQTVTDLNDLATLTRANRTVGQLGNPSRSGVLLANTNQAKAAAGMLANAATVGVIAAQQWVALAAGVGLSRMIASPGVARALVRGARSGKVEVAARALTALAARTPTAQQDILAFRDAITGKVPDYAATATFTPPEQPIEAAAPIPVEEEGIAPIDPAMAGEVNPFDQFDGG